MTFSKANHGTPSMNVFRKLRGSNSVPSSKSSAVTPEYYRAAPFQTEIFRQSAYRATYVCLRQRGKFKPLQVKGVEILSTKLPKPHPKQRVLRVAEPSVEESPWHSRPWHQRKPLGDNF